MGLLSLNITCPHCLRERAVIEGFAEKQVGNESIFNVAFTCRSCEGGIIASVLELQGRNIGPWKASKSSDANVVLPNNAYHVSEVFPVISRHTAPEHSPARAAKFFVEAKDNYQRQNYETTVMLCRKVLDIATREILGDESGTEQLSQRISMLHAKGKITEQMKDWAHIVRIDSNGAVHSDEEFSAGEANQILNFTEVFMLYAFTLPAMVTSRQAQKSAN
jgi:hypothetical protein